MYRITSQSLVVIEQDFGFPYGYHREIFHRIIPRIPETKNKTTHILFRLCFLIFIWYMKQSLYVLVQNMKAFIVLIVWNKIQVKFLKI